MIGNPLEVAGSPDEHQALQALITMRLGLGQEKSTQASFLFRPAADHNHLTGLDDEIGAQVAQRFFLLAVRDLKLLRRHGTDIGHRGVGALNWPKMEFGS